MEQNQTRENKVEKRNVTKSREREEMKYDKNEEKQQDGSGCLTIKNTKIRRDKKRTREKIDEIRKRGNKNK